MSNDNTPCCVIFSPLPTMIPPSVFVVAGSIPPAATDFQVPSDDKYLFASADCGAGTRPC